MILPQMEQSALYEQYTMEIPARDPINHPMTSTALPAMTCPSAPETRVVVNPNGTVGSFAKITYGLNAGTDESNDGHDWDDDRERGVATSAIPRGARMADLVDGTTQTLLLSEIFVADSNQDTRGAWAMATSCMVGGRGGRHGSMDPTGLQNRIITPNKNPDQFGGQFRDNVAHCDNGIRGQGRCNDRGGGGDNGKDVINGARSWHRGGVHVALCDGSVQFYTDSVDVVVWYALLTAANGENPPQ
jgi:prepilin-type processing-associated H-X9-DG protein